MKKKLSKAEQIRRDMRALCRDVGILRNEIVEITGKMEETCEMIVDIAYLLAPVIHDVRTNGKFPLKGRRLVAELIRNNKRGDMTKLEQAFWTGEEVE